MTTTQTLAGQLSDNKVHQQFVEHPFFANVNTMPLTREQVAVFLGQWWHPLHYFPTFLARCVAILPGIDAKSAITRILAQEVGNGKTSRAHEVIYTKSMAAAGFDPAVVSGSAPFEETARLVEGYRAGSETAESALGTIYATEVTDLLMVSSIGTTVERVTGVTNNEWVRIHIAQEPDHVEQAKLALLGGLSAEQEAAVLASAEELWRLWTGFFDRLSAEIDQIAVEPAR